MDLLFDCHADMERAMVLLEWHNVELYGEDRVLGVECCADVELVVDLLQHYTAVHVSQEAECGEDS